MTLPDLPVKSITVSEVIDEEGGRVLTIDPENVSIWDAMGLLEYAMTVYRVRATHHINKDDGEHG